MTGREIGLVAVLFVFLVWKFSLKMLNDFEYASYEYEWKRGYCDPGLIKYLRTEEDRLTKILELKNIINNADGGSKNG